MKLQKFFVQNYKSINDTGLIEVLPITCLVGKNESGKTSVLQALTKLHPLNPNNSKFDLEEYPRSKLNEYKRVHEKNPAIAIKAYFELTADEMEEIEDSFGQGAVESTNVSLTKKYNNTLYYDVKVNEKKHAEFLFAKHSIPEEIIKQLDATNFETIQKTIAGISNPDKNLEALKIEMAKIEKDSLSSQVYDHIEKNYLPSFFYFDEYSTLPGVINLTRLQRVISKQEPLKESDETALALIRLVGAKVEEFLQPANFERLTADLEAASNHITDQIFKFWSQNKDLEVQFSLENKSNEVLLHIRIKNLKHRVTVPFDKRSKGFVWFFSFLVAFSDYRNKNSNLLLLLDEPGLNLHARAQGDLLRYIETELTKHHQVIYSTHSPFMIDANHWERIRTVQDKELEGTKVSNDPLETDSDTLFPLQAALGYDIAQTLFVSTNNLLIEGPSDLIYLNLANSFLDKADRLSDKWALVPVGGADKISTFVSLLGGSKLNVAAFIDIAKRDQQRIDSLIKSKLMHKSKLITAGQVLSCQEADIEDLFDSGMFLELVSEAYKDELTGKKLSPKDLNASIPRIVKRVETYFEQNKVANGHFNHFRPANVLMNNPDLVKKLFSTTALENFKKAFGLINAQISD